MKLFINVDAEGTIWGKSTVSIENAASDAVKTMTDGHWDTEEDWSNGRGYEIMVQEDHMALRAEVEVRQISDVAGDSRWEEVNS